MHVCSSAECEEAVQLDLLYSLFTDQNVAIVGHLQKY